MAIKIDFRTNMGRDADDDCRVSLWRDSDDPNGWRGRLCTPANPDGEIWQVRGCDLNEALMVMFEGYRRWIEARFRREAVDRARK